jgi:hypothetical protein
MNVNIRAILNGAIDTNMDSMANQLNAIDNFQIIAILSRIGIANIQKSMDIQRNSNQYMEGQLKLFRANKKALRTERLAIK